MYLHIMAIHEEIFLEMPPNARTKLCLFPNSVLVDYIGRLREGVTAISSQCGAIYILREES